MAVFRAFYRSFGRMLFVSVLCFACGFLSARAEEYTIAYLNQHGDEISDLTPDRYTEEELPLEKENLPNSEAVSIATGCELADELWYWNNEMSEPVDKIESVSDEGTTLYGNLDCGENRIVTLNPGGKEGIGSEGTRTLYYYRNLGESGEFFYNEYNGSKSASGVASSIVLPTYDTEEYTFLGYYADPEDLETQCIDERGYITEYGIQQMAEGGEGETSWDAVYEVTIPGQYTVSYTCGANGSGNPASQSINSYGDIVLHPASVCTPDSGYEFFGWSCYFPGSSPDTTVRAAGESIFVNGSGICTALWVAACPNSGVHESILDDYLGSSADLVNSGFSSYATVSISGKCSSTPGQYQFQSQVSEPASGAGYCWCHITSLSDTGGANSSNVSSYSPWMFINDTYTCSSDSDCTSPCSRYSYSFAAERISLTDACAYNLSYTCGVISGSVSSPQSDTVFVNETVNLQQSVSGCTYVWGATFLGWDCHVPGNSTTINNGYSLTMQSNNVVCDALWDVPQYTLTYDCGGNGIEPAGATQAGGSNVTLENGCINADTSNYDFNGWYCISGSSVMGAAYNGGDLYTLYDNTTCTAIWTESNPCDPGFVSHQEIVGVFDENSFEEYNWTDHSLFWEFPAGSGQTVSLTGMCSNTPGMFGVAGNPTQTGTIADTYCWCQVTTYGSTPLSGYPWVYSGFNTTDCDTSSCSARCMGETPGIVWDNPDAQELFLQSLFIKNICEYTLTYDCNNGNNAQSALSGGTYEGGQSIGLWAGGGNCDAPTGQTFDYWDCDNGIGTPPNNTVNPTPYNNMTCTAHWANVPYPITYNCNNGNIAQSSVNGGTAYMGSTVQLEEALSSNNTGLAYVNVCDQSYTHSFSLWECYDENGNSVNLSFTNVEQTIQQIDNMPASNVECIAQWQRMRWPVSYICGQFNNNGTAHDTDFFHNSSYNNFDVSAVYPDLCTPDSGYTFDHWNCYHGTPGGTIDMNTIVNDGTNIIHPYPYDTVCVAQWNSPVATYRVTYHGGTCVPSAPDYQSDPINAGDSYTVENPNCAFANSNYFIPTNNCYEFVGWSDENPDQVENPTIDYNNCDNCANQTGSCGTINSVSANIDLYAICNVKNHSVIYHDCDDTYTYTDSNAVWIGQSPNYTPLSPSVAPLSSSNLEIDPLSSFQGWATSPMDDDDKSWCTYGSDDLYPILYGGNGKKTKYNYSVSADKLCHDIDLYAVCCPLNLSWILNGGQWPTDPNNQTTLLQNQTSCEYGAIAGQSGSITPLQTPLKPGYTFNGWLVTGYTP